MAASWVVYLAAYSVVETVLEMVALKVVVKVQRLDSLLVVS